MYMYYDSLVNQTLYRFGFHTSSYYRFVHAKNTKELESGRGLFIQLIM